jgi:hypothetical protein
VVEDGTVLNRSVGQALWPENYSRQWNHWLNKHEKMGEHVHPWHWENALEMDSLNKNGVTSVTTSLRELVVNKSIYFWELLAWFFQSLWSYVFWRWCWNCHLAHWGKNYDASLGINSLQWVGRTIYDLSCTRDIQENGKRVH